MDDDGYAVHYSEVRRGTPVIDRDGRQALTLTLAASEVEAIAPQCAPLSQLIQPVLGRR